MESDLQRLIQSIEKPGPKAIVFVERAYLFARKWYLAHFDDGEKVLARAVESAEYVGSCGLGALALSTALLADLPLSKEGVLEELEVTFSKRLRVLIERTHTLSLIQFEAMNPHSVDSFSAFLVATAKDLRILIAVIARHLVTLRHQYELSSTDAKKIARESMTLYIPLAERLGMYTTVRELEDRSFAIIHPRIYKALYNALSIQETEEAVATEDFKAILEKQLAEGGVLNPIVEARTKTIYSIYKKAKKVKKSESSHFYDIHAVRVVVQSIPECYHALGIIHSYYSPLPGRLKDYIALPKHDGYQSLHTTIKTPDNLTIEVQIRTTAMDHYAKSGLHPFYKSRKRTGVLRWFPFFFPPPSYSKSTEEHFASTKLPSWLQILTEPEAFTTPTDHEHELRYKEFLKSQIFVFDSNGRVLRLHSNATVADYIDQTPIPSEHPISLRIDNIPVTGDTPLKNGDIVEVLESSMDLS